MMTFQRILFVSVVLLLVGLIQGCSVPKNKLSLYQRSMVIDNEQTANTILAKATMQVIDEQGLEGLNIVSVSGTPYEMGFQHGVLLRDEIQVMYSKIIRRAKIFSSEQMMAELYDLMEPYIPIEEKEEMRGLAHGADVPLRLVHWIHMIPGVAEHGAKKKFRRGFSSSSCSNVVAFGQATADGELYQLRVLDWMRELGVQQWPLILVHRPKVGYASVSYTYSGFIGSVSGMNEQKLAFGEMGYGDPANETLEGMPFIFLFRKLQREASNLQEVEQIIRSVQRTNSFVYMISDVKATAGEPNALLFITDRDRVLTFGENTLLIDEREKKRKKKVEKYLPINDVVYAGAKGPALYENLQNYYGELNLETLQQMTEAVSLKSNMHNVVFRPATLESWVSNASMANGNAGKASHQRWFYFNFADSLTATALLDKGAQ
ncbi:MAG: hypothetical protein JRG71_10150 [Deltaproteobacteria bacterium]|nr:hypothetical protein [Deltaproteobacteria bacterium]